MKQLFILLLASTLLAGCTTYSGKKKQTALDETLLHYEKAIRWGNFVAARRFQPRETDRPQTTTNLDRIKVTSYRQVSSQPLADDNEVIITVQIDYYHDDTLTIHTLRDEQVWKYNPDDPGWHITTPLPAFR